MQKNQLPVGDFNMILSNGVVKGKSNSIQISLYLLFPIKPYAQMRFDSFHPGRTSQNSHFDVPTSPSILMFLLEQDWWILSHYQELLTFPEFFSIIYSTKDSKQLTFGWG